MPATKLSRKYSPVSPTYQLRQLETLIRVGMARKGITTLTELALLMGISLPALSKRMSGDTEWSFLEVCRLVRILGLAADEVYRVIGGPAA